jgi:ATP-dependent Clp protease ATP-binding subunit ClpA
VAEALGVSKQSAHRRYASRLDEPTPLPRRRAVPAPEERILVTPQARRAVRAARAAARALGHVSVDPGHLLLGLMVDTSGPASRALTAIGVDFDAAREAVGRLGLPATPAGASAKRRVPISDAAREALERSLLEARRLGHQHLGVEHLLLGLLRDEQGGAARALDDIGIASDDLERCLGKVLKEAPFDRS